MQITSARTLYALYKNQRISTHRKALDEFLNGGIALKQITELVGTSSADITQMCLQLCLSAVAPKSVGGLGAKVLFIDTRRNFQPDKLRELATNLEKQLKHKVNWLTASQVISQVLYVECINPASLVAAIMNCQMYLGLYPNIKLIIVDSLSFPIRMMDNVCKRTSVLIELHDCINSLVCIYDVAIVFTNELGNYSSGKHWRMKPVLGEKHLHLINERIWLTNNEYYIGKLKKFRKKIPN